ncbi:MAG: hypothetical protein IPJ49_28905 [Candidatus Obscuribacter sp.]|nr:hypothetical protein [Candidatus Obscuribacter sp.]
MTKYIVLKVSQCAIARASLLTVALLAAASISATYVTLQALGKEHKALKLASKSTDKNSLPSSLKELMHATTFDDSAAGESGQSQNYKNYSAAVARSRLWRPKTCKISSPRAVQQADSMLQYCSNRAIEWAIMRALPNF